MMHTDDVPADSSASNYTLSWYARYPSAAVRQMGWEIAWDVMNRIISEPEPRLLDPDHLD